MSASAQLAARSVSNMEECPLDEGGGEDKEQTTECKDVLDDDMVLLEKPDMTSQQDEVDAQLRAMAVSTTTSTSQRSVAAVGGGSGGGGGGSADTAPSSTGTRSAGESIDGRDVSTCSWSRHR